MFKKSICTVYIIVTLLIISITTQLQAEINFDFALPIFKQDDVNFEKTKPTDYNFQLLKKYILEHEGNVIAQYNAIVRWFSLIKLSDTPRHDELIASGNKYFSTKEVKNPSNEAKLREIFYRGILLSLDKGEDPEGIKDQEFEELILDSDDELHEIADFWIAKGLIFHLLKNRPNGYFSLMKPEEDLKTALAILPKTAQYYYIMGQCFRFIGGTDSAMFLSIASYEKSASLDPRNAKLQTSLLSIYMALHEEFQAKNKQEPFWLEEAVYKKILEMSPGNPHALNNLGYLYAEYGVNTQTALELCQKAVDMAPEVPGFYDSLGWAAFKNKDIKLAEESLLKSIEMRDNVYESHYHLATIYYSSNQYEKAAEQYAQAIVLRPDSAEALNNLAYLYTEQKIKTDEAISMAEAANKIEPNNASYLDTLGWAYYRKGKLDDALLYLQKANSLVPAQGEILLHLGRVYLDKNDFDTALSFVKEAFKADKNLNDPDDTLYLAIRLRAYHAAMADYHGLLGEKADKAKVINILKGISELYQEQGLYDKSIEITRICSELSNGSKTLKEPLLNSYKLAKPLIKKEKQTTTEEIVPSEESEEKQEAEPTDESNSEEPADSQSIDNTSNENDSQSEKPVDEKNELFKVLPPQVDYPIAVNFGPDFFEKLNRYFPQAELFIDSSVTVFVDRIIAPEETAVLRVSSSKFTGKFLRNLITTMYSFGKKPECKEESEELSRIDFLTGSYNCITKENEVYLSKKDISEADIASLTNILPYRKDILMELYFDNEIFRNRFFSLFRGFVSNPIEPFTRLQSTYKLDGEDINEFIIATTGKDEGDDFVRSFAKRLFAFKLETKKKGLNTTIKLQSNQGHIYVSTDFEKPITWLSKQIDDLTNKITSFMPFLKGLVPCITK